MIIQFKNEVTQGIHHKKYWVKITAALVATLIISLILLYKLPVFSNYQAAKFFNKNYKQLRYRYDEVQQDDFLPVFRRAVTETLTTNASRYLNNVTIPSININIDFESWEGIKAERSAMLGRRVLTDNRNYYKASVRYNGKSIPIKIRLKGERADNINKEKRWAFRIKTRKGKTLFGMKNFAIQHPLSRGYQRESIFQEFARQQGFIPLKFFYVDASINGENIGMMAVEEVPAKEMLEREGYKEGLLFQLDDSNVKKLYHSVFDSIVGYHPDVTETLGKEPVSTLYRAKYSHQQQYYRLYKIYYNSLNAPIDEITDKKSSPDYLRQRPVATGLLKGLLEGRIKPSSVFDAEKIGKFFGFLALWGDSHAASFRNIRFYFNPYTFKFEPIAHDSNAYKSTRTWLFPNLETARDHEMNRILMADPAILKAYTDAIEYYYQLALSDELLPMMRSFEAKPLAELREEFWYMPEMNFTSMKTAISAIRQQVNSGEFYNKARNVYTDQEDPDPLVIPENYRVPEVVQAELVKSGNRYRLELHNLFPLNAYITELKIKIDGRTSPLETHLKQTLPINIEPFYYNQFFSHTDIDLENLSGRKNISISGKVIVETQETVEYDFTARNGFLAMEKHPLKSLSSEELTSTYPFISYAESERAFLIRTGTHIIRERIIFPKNATLRIQPGTELLFEENAGMLIKGRVLIRGTAEAPIVFDSVNTNSTRGWSGFTVMQAKQRSELDHVEFRNTGFTQSRSWQLTGAVTFYQSDVDISNTRFIGTVAEDALNIVSSDFSLVNSKIEQTRSDGFDADFASGQISDSQFNNIGGDGIDFSGSDIKILNSSFREIHDKAISAGEKSIVHIESVKVINSGTGLAVKDGSMASIKSSVFESIEYSTLMSYNKKNTYGPAELKATDISYDKHEYALIAQKGNRLIMDGEEIRSIKIDIEKLYQDGYMKK